MAAPAPRADITHMSLFGAPNTQGLAGAHAAANQPHARPVRKEPQKSRAPARAEDEVIMGTEQTDAPQRIQRMASNEQQDAQRDHQQRAGYSRRGPLNDNNRPRLDTSG